MVPISKAYFQRRRMKWGRHMVQEYHEMTIPVRTSKPKTETQSDPLPNSSLHLETIPHYGLPNNFKIRYCFQSLRFIKLSSTSSKKALLLKAENGELTIPNNFAKTFTFICLYQR